MRTATKPRYIKPESVSIGDTIRVTYPPELGIEISKVGTVASREYVGQERHCKTADGGTLLVWHPAHKAPRITLLDHPAAEHTQLFAL